MSMKNQAVLFGTFSSVTASAVETLAWQNAPLENQDRINYVDLRVTVSGSNSLPPSTNAFIDQAQLDTFLGQVVGSVTWRKNAGSPFMSNLDAGNLRKCLLASGFDPFIAGPQIGQSVNGTVTGISLDFTLRIPLTPYWCDALGYACAPSYEQMSSSQFSLTLQSAANFVIGATTYTLSARSITAFACRSRLGRRSVGPGILYQAQSWNAQQTGQPLKLQEGLYLGLSLAQSPNTVASGFGLDVYLDSVQIYDSTNFDPRQVAGEYVDDIIRDGIGTYVATNDLPFATMAISPLFWCTSRSLNNELAIARRVVTIQTPLGTGYSATETVVSASISATDNRGGRPMSGSSRVAIPARNSGKAIQAETLRTGVNLMQYLSVLEA